MNYLIIYLGKNNPLYDSCLRTFGWHLRNDDKVTVISDCNRGLGFRHDTVFWRDYVNPKDDPFFFRKDIRVEHRSDYLKFKWLSWNRGVYFDSNIIHFKDYHDLFEFDHTFQVEVRHQISVSAMTNAGFEKEFINRLNAGYDRYHYEFVLNLYEEFIKWYFPKSFNAFYDSYRQMDYKDDEATFLTYLRYYAIPFTEQIVGWYKEFNENYYESLKMRLKNDAVYGMKLMKSISRTPVSRDEYANKLIGEMEL